MLFEKVVGQHKLKQSLIHLTHTHHLPHAIMLYGREGIGGLPLAIALAQFIQCQNKQNNDSCGVCPACIKVNSLQHPDVHFSFPTIRKDPGKAPVSNDFLPEFRAFVNQNPYAPTQVWLQHIGDEKQGNITANECREIIKKLQLRSFESEYKILIMWHPESLGNEGNILLKLIEEPTDKTIIIFVASQLDHVLTTIQSRTQLFPLQPLTTEEIVDELGHLGLAANLATQIAKICDGNYYKALALLEQKENDYLNPLRAWLNCLYSNNGLELVDWISGLSEKSKEFQKQFLLYTQTIFEHLIRYQHLGSETVVLAEAEENMIKILITKQIRPNQINFITSLVNDTLYFLERNANSKILFHSLSLRIQETLMAEAKM